MHSMDGFLLFHHNLNFSSIDAEDRQSVISKCYWPLLQMAEKLSLPVNIEFPAWTLEQIQLLDPDYIEKVRSLVKAGLVEIVGSGYSQLIGPLFPVQLNSLNLRLGQEVYHELLGLVPKVALINEKAVSGSVLGVYLDAGFERVVMESDNVALAHHVDNKNEIRRFKRLKAGQGRTIAVSWTDSIFFQKFQRLAHGADTEESYMRWLNDVLCDFDGPVPLYTNDVEVFNYRPGRFAEEADIAEDEWSSISKVLATTSKLGLRYSLLSDLPSSGGCKESLAVNSLSYPIPVKKQPKYNLARWAVSGQDDQVINTRVHRIIRLLKASPEIFGVNDKKLLCHLCASDFRTHITAKRWASYLHDLSRLEEDLGVCGGEDADRECFPALTNARVPDVQPCLNIQTETCQVDLNLRKGLAIERLDFGLADDAVSVRSYPHGFFSAISYGADFYSGTVLVESLTELKRYTDLSSMKVYYVDDERQVVGFEAMMCGGKLKKQVGLSAKKPGAVYRVVGRGINCGQVIVRLGNFMLSNAGPETLIRFTSGGQSIERFLVDSDFNHASAVSPLVSSTTGLGAPDGWVEILNRSGGVRLSWDNGLGFLYPMLINKMIQPENFCRLIFSVSEIDDTSKPKILNFTTEIEITPVRGESYDY